MADAPDWPKVLSLTVHEFRTPLTVVAGYLRMLSTDRVGPLTDTQRRVVEEAERSCARLSALLGEVSDVAHFHQGRLTFMRGPVALSRLLEGITLPETPERPVRLAVGNGAGELTLEGDATRLGMSLSAVAAATAREIADAAVLHVVPELRDVDGARRAFVAIGSEAVAHEILTSPLAALPAFDATRGGSGLSLVLARQVLEEHGAQLYGAPGDRPRAGAGIAFPLSS
ncbi:MAG TPA: histidine kinase dimerization/phospho-acceptor domain-containing protein [Vicinamibacterales bacterium]